MTMGKVSLSLSLYLSPALSIIKNVLFLAALCLARHRKTLREGANVAGFGALYICFEAKISGVIKHSQIPHRLPKFSGSSPTTSF